MAGQPFRFVHIFPSAVTLSALCCGVSSIRSSLRGHFEFSVLFLVLSALLDGLDGHVARVLKASTLFGAELDSLCDLVDFGVAPALIIYLWSSAQAPGSISDDIVWLSCLAFFSACSCRLARFNVSNDATLTCAICEKVREEASLQSSETTNKKTDEPEAQKWKYLQRSKFFEGVPAPVAGFLALMPMVASFQFPHLQGGVDVRVCVLVSNLAISFLMVCNLPTLSSKMLMRNPRKESHLRSRSPLTLVLKVLVVVAVVATATQYPWVCCLVVAVLYVLLLPLGAVAYRHFSQ